MAIREGAKLAAANGMRPTMMEWERMSFLDKGALAEAYAEHEATVLSEVLAVAIKKVTG